jgi:hypothetical protein
VLAFDAGLAIDPNAAGLLALRSNAEDYLGRFEQAKSDIQQAMLLSPRDPAMGQWFNLRADTEARRLKPDLSIKWLLKHKPVLQFAFDGLRKAGLPEE